MSNIQILILVLIVMFDINWIIDRICRCVEHRHVADSYAASKEKATDAN